MKKSTFVIIVFTFITLLLSSCDPCNPMGFRGLGIVTTRITQEIDIFALEPNWGPCYQYVYLTKDGGLTWDPFDYYEKKYELEISRLDCTQSCEFNDLLNEQILYRIEPGKTLLRSMDGGNTWQEELHIPAWTRMEKNFVNKVFMDIGVPRDERGPFSAITDPKTGNLIVVMGFEGILVRPPDGDWTWIIKHGFTRIQPSRMDLLGLIQTQEWLRGPLIALFLMLIGLSRLGNNKFRFLKTLLSILAVWFLLIPFIINFDLLYFIFPEIGMILEKHPFVENIPPLLVILSLLGVIFINSKQNIPQAHDKVKNVILISILGALGFWFIFIMWSQGIIYATYTIVFLVGILLVFIALLGIIFMTPKKTRHFEERVD